MSVMSPTPDFNTVELVWMGVTLNGQPVTGGLTLSYNSETPLLDDDPTQPISIYPTSISVQLTTTSISVGGTPKQVGYASVRVPASNDPDISGSGGTYTLTEQLTNAKGVTRVFVADKDTIGGKIYLNRLSSTAPVPGEPLPAVTYAEFLALNARVTAIEIAGGIDPGPGGTAPVVSVAGKVGVVTLTPSDVGLNLVDNVPDASKPVSTAQTAAIAAAVAPKANTSAVVALTGDQTVAGVKTFSSAPVVPNGSFTAAKISDFTEAAQDAVAALLAGASGVTLTYDDTANTLTITGGGSGSVDPEAVRDLMGVALVGTAPITITVNDVSDTITISTTATVNSTDAQLRDRSTHTGLQPMSSITDLVNRLAAAPYVIYFDGTARSFGPIPNPRPAPKITFDASKVRDFDPETEAPNTTSHPLLAVGDALLFYAPPA